MKCPKCGNKDIRWCFDDSWICRSCDYKADKEQFIVAPEPTTVEMLLDGAEKTGYIEAIRLVKNRKWSVIIGGYQGLSEKLSEAVSIAYKEAIRNEEIKQAYKGVKEQDNEKS